MRPTRSLLSAAALALVAAVPAFAQHAQLGLHGGYNSGPGNFLIGGQAVVPISPSLDFYPSLDYHFLSGGNQVGINVDLRLKNPYAEPGPAWYAGGGLAVLRNSVVGGSNTYTGADIFAGLEGRTGTVRPYGEVRGLLNSNSSIQLVAGVNWTLY